MEMEIEGKTKVAYCIAPLHNKGCCRSCPNRQLRVDVSGEPVQKVPYVEKLTNMNHGNC